MILNIIYDTLERFDLLKGQAHMKKFLKFAVIGICSLVFFDSNCVTLKVTCRAKGVELKLFQEAINQWIKLTGDQHKVEIVTLPHSSNECFALYKQWLSAESFDVDILQMDFPWIGAFGDILIDLNQFYKDGEIDKDDIFTTIKNNMHFNGNMVALPAYTDCEVMYYRKDLLKKYNRSVPNSWQELYETAKFIQKQERKSNNRFYGYIFQAKAFEMLTCNFVQLIDTFGGAVINREGRAVVDSQECVDALVLLINCLKNASTRSVLNYSEEEARGLFQSGNALFMSSWPYAWSLMNDPSTSVSGRIGVMPIPTGNMEKGKSSGVIGGWFFTVSKFSKHGAVAADLVKFLTSKEQHKFRAEFAYAPAYKSLYKDPEILKKNSFFSVLSDSLENAVARPSSTFGKDYPRASHEIFNLINTALTESLEEVSVEKIAKKYLGRLNRRLNKIIDRQKDSKKKKSSEGIFQKLKDILGTSSESN
ncbi:MAG: ABC transporter substrate-binding protein [Alphaproteobacteria bacterium]|nr:ABC transporter substrate-binding protein [Alphaproteobacteria bacterium]